MATIFYTKISANGRPIFGLLVAKDNNTRLTVQVVSNAVGDSVVQINACAKKAQLGAFDANLLLGRVEYHVVACGGAPGGGTLLEAIAHEIPVPSQDGDSSADHAWSVNFIERLVEEELISHQALERVQNGL